MKWKAERKPPAEHTPLTRPATSTVARLGAVVPQHAESPITRDPRPLGPRGLADRVAQSAGTIIGPWLTGRSGS